MIDKTQQTAKEILHRHYTPPQRYGTAFHVTPPVTDVRELNITSFTRTQDLHDWMYLRPEDQSRFLSFDARDVYLIWHLAHFDSVSTRLIFVPAGTSKTERLTTRGDGSELYFVVLEAGTELTIEDDYLDAALALRRMVVIQHENSKLVFAGVRARQVFSNEALTVHLVGKGASATVTHFLYGGDQDQADLAVTVHHEAPHTTSLLTARSAVGGKASSIYRGLIDVRPEGRGSRGYQQGRSLLLNDGVVSDMLPKLEIATDDVQCSHGVTTTHLDDASLFYMRSRGLSEADSRYLATIGFYHNQLAIPERIATVLEDVIQHS